MGINILYCGDAGVVKGVGVSILSLMMRGGENIYNIYIATIEYEGVKPFPREEAERLDKIVKKYNPRNSVTLIDATEVFVQNLPKKNMGSYFTPCSMLRLFADKMSELEKCDRVLYLDYDVVCRGGENGAGGGLKEFYETPLGGIEAAGVLDIYGKHFYHYHGLFKQDYMNSGVMLFNLKLCRKTKCLERAAELCASQWMMLADQAALNKTITFRKLMPRKYNEQGERPREDTVLHHFSNNFKFFPYFRVQKVKPFEIEKVHDILHIYEYDDIYKEYNNLWKSR